MQLISAPTYTILYIVIMYLGTMCTSNYCTAQTQYSFNIKKTDLQNGNSIEDFFDSALHSKDSISFISNLNKDITNLWKNGYLTAEIDTTIVENDTITSYIFIGEKYLFGAITIDNTNKAIVLESGLKNVRWSDKVVNADMVSEYADAILIYLENNGYPFAKVSFDSTRINEGILSSKLNIIKNNFVPFDSLNVIGNIDLRKSYLDRYLDINANQPYSRQKIKNIQKRINDLPFLQYDSSTQIKFINKKAEVELHLKPKKASRFDFIIGVLPSNNNGERTFAITGEFTAEMYNRLGQGEYIFANIQSIDPTRQLELRFKYPYLFDLPIGTDIQGGIYFNEEFRETILNTGILYQFDGNASLKASWNFKSSRLITIDSSSIIASQKLPQKLDISYNGGGIEYTVGNLDYRFNPSRGYTIKLGGTVGIKKIIKNNTIESLSTPDLDFGAKYDSLQATTFQTELSVSGAAYLPALQVGTVKFGIEGGLLYNQEQVFENELHRIGGNKLLRGFDEQSILTDIYLVSTLEFRLLLDRNSYLSFPFIDYGITKIRNQGESVWDNALSFGMGINFATPAGIFNVSFAAGKRLNNPIDFGNTKIHFGYVSLF